MKKAFILVAVTIIGLLVLAACGDSGNGNTGNQATASAGTATPAPAAPAPAAPAPAGSTATVQLSGPIDVITREAGSGTRTAFVEFVGVEVDGVDRTYIEAVVQTGTGAVIGAVAGNEYAIGYISLGAMRDDIRAVPINGVSATAANVQNGTYPLYRSFNLAVPFELSELAQDFLDFILSAEGQAIVSGRNYIAIGENLPAFTGGGLTGSLVITGSTSIVPLMEHIVNAYTELNPGVSIGVHSTGSGAGVTDATEGRADFGLVSREIRPTELENVNSVTMAHDGIAVIVNNDNNISSLTIEEVRDIFIGELTRWQDVN